jgi:hypothetical protein
MTKNWGKNKNNSNNLFLMEFALVFFPHFPSVLSAFCLEKFLQYQK